MLISRSCFGDGRLPFADQTVRQSNSIKQSRLQGVDIQRVVSGQALAQLLLAGIEPHFVISPILLQPPRLVNKSILCILGHLKHSYIYQKIIGATIGVLHHSNPMNFATSVPKTHLQSWLSSALLGDLHQNLSPSLLVFSIVMCLPAHTSHTVIQSLYWGEEYCCIP